MDDFISRKILPERSCLGLGFFTVAVVLLLLGAVLTIPFLFESPSLWYKSGIEKTCLRFGKMVGLAAGFLLLLQLPMASRSKILDRIFSLPGLMRQHRLHAGLIAFLALLHPLLVLLPEDKIIVPLETRYWPEWIGVGLLTVILVQFASSQWRQHVGMVFHHWLLFHRILGLMIAALLTVHTLYVSEIFAEPDLPQSAAGIAASCFMLQWFWIRAS